MAAWFAHALPYIPDLIKLARPLFTRSRPQDQVPEVVARQITELQEIAAQNTDAIKTLAIEMQNTINSLQAGAEVLAQELRWARMIAIVCVVAAILAVGLAAYALANGGSAG